MCYAFKNENLIDVFKGVLLMRNQHSNLSPKIGIDCFIK